MKLSISERLILAGLLPHQGNVATLKLLRQFREALALNAKEIAKCNLREEGQMIRWDTDKEFETEIEFGPWRTELARRVLQDLEAQQKLTEQHLSLCEKFEIGSEPKS